MRRFKRVLLRLLALAALFVASELWPRGPVPVSRILDDGIDAAAILNLTNEQRSRLADFIASALPGRDEAEAKGQGLRGFLLRFVAPRQMALSVRSDLGADLAWSLYIRPRRLPLVCSVIARRRATASGLNFTRHAGGLRVGNRPAPDRASRRSPAQSLAALDGPGLNAWLANGQGFGRVLSDTFVQQGSDLDADLGPCILSKIKDFRLQGQMGEQRRIELSFELDAEDGPSLGVYRFFLLAARDLAQEQLAPKNVDFDLSLEEKEAHRLAGRIEIQGLDRFLAKGSP